MNQHAIIAKIFTDVLLHGKTLDDALIKHKATDHPFVKAHCYGLCRWYFKLDHIAKKLLTKPMKEKDTDIYVLILLGLHQIFHSDIKEHALVSETVEAALVLKKLWAKAVVNACLRRALREKSELQSIEHYAHPQWMIDHVKKSWPSDWQNILQANNHQAPMALRVNKHGEQACVYLEAPLPVNDIAGFIEGTVSVQDEASQYVAPLLQLKPGDKVLDACAAPGGKTGHMLEIEPNIELTATDISESRLEKVKENLQRLRLDKNVTFKVVDAVKSHWPPESFDKILIDAPCSGTGVIRRHPDIKLLRRQSDIKNFAKQQLEILNTLWLSLKKDGKLVYTTCSIMPEENEHVIHDFLNTHADAKVEKIHVPIGLAQQYGWQCFPRIHRHDGFYYCLLTKSGSELA